MACPTLFTDVLASGILNRIADDQCLRAVCRDEGLPNRETVRARWRDDADFRNLHAQARQEETDSLGEETSRSPTTARTIGCAQIVRTARATA